MTPTPNWTHYAEVLRVVDGDTLVVSLDLGKYIHKVRVEAPIRIASLYCPELNEPGGKDARAHTMGLATPGMTVTVTTRKPDPRDPYGRIVADVTLPDGRDLATVVAEAGHGEKR